MAPAIRVENLGKCYRVNHAVKRRGYRTLRESLSGAATRLVNRLRRRPERGQVEDFWALKDVSFDVQPGEVVGIIGRNGAGKSTLLKILSRITKPTRGEVSIHGRIGSLLEVGTGFHPELTGRENVFLNGSILGMSRWEVAAKFDEIVAFSEVERFLDTPVKRYSSGMYVRLAFAVAAHLEPEILVVDEVLAVGDVQFQKKCLGKMGAVAKGGRTVLFVSHNMAAIEALCSSAVLLSGGVLAAKGPTKQIVGDYLRDVSSKSTIPLHDRTDRQSSSGAVRFTSITFTNGLGHIQPSFQCGEDAAIVLRFENTSARELRHMRVALGINNELGQRILLLDSQLLGEDLDRVFPGPGAIRVSIPKLPLLPGRYDFNLYATVNGTVADWVCNACFFDVEAGDYFGTGQLPPPAEGFFVTEHSFQYERVRAEAGSNGVNFTGLPSVSGR